MAMGWGGLFFGSIVFMFIAFAVSVLAFIFWIFMLVDAVKRKYKQNDEKIVWILVIVLTGIIGALIYYFVEKKKDKK